MKGQASWYMRKKDRGREGEREKFGTFCEFLN